MNINKIKKAQEIKFANMNKPCVYFLTDKNGDVVYIGKTYSIGVRIGEHMGAYTFDRLFVMACNNDEEALQKEAEMIFKFQPQRNRSIAAWRVGLVAKYVIMKQLKEMKKTYGEFEAIMWMEKINPVYFKDFKYYPAKSLEIIKKYA